jgi:hypothetical protein
METSQISLSVPHLSVCHNDVTQLGVKCGAGTINPSGAPEFTNGF